MKIFFTTLLFVCMTAFSYAEIKVTDTLQPIIQEFEQSDQNTLVLLDIGGTLLALSDPVWHRSNHQWTKAWFQQNYPNMTREDYLGLVRIVEGNVKNWHLVDKNWPEAIEKAQIRGAKVLAFTKVAQDPLAQFWRVALVKAFDLPFKDEFPELASGATFVYKNGVIETSAALKGPVLEEVLAKLPAKPKKILFVDDSLDQIESVAYTCHKAGIPCIAFHYVASHAAPPFDPIAADRQLKALISKG